MYESVCICAKPVIVSLAGHESDFGAFGIWHGPKALNFVEYPRAFMNNFLPKYLGSLGSLGFYTRTNQYSSWMHASLDSRNYKSRSVL